MFTTKDWMQWAVNEGVNGFVEASFAGGRQPLDTVTGYPLTPDITRVRYIFQYPYQTLEDTFLKHVQWADDYEPSINELQDWTRYFWQYVKLELVENFSDILPVSEWVFEKTRREMEAMGYERRNR